MNAVPTWAPEAPAASTAANERGCPIPPAASTGTSTVSSTPASSDNSDARPDVTAGFYPLGDQRRRLPHRPRPPLPPPSQPATTPGLLAREPHRPTSPTAHSRRSPRAGTRAATSRTMFPVSISAVKKFPATIPIRTTQHDSLEHVVEIAGAHPCVVIHPTPPAWPPPPPDQRTPPTPSATAAPGSRQPTSEV